MEIESIDRLYLNLYIHLQFCDSRYLAKGEVMCKCFNVSKCPKGILLLILLQSFASQANAANRTLEGQATLIWGDPRPGTAESARLALLVRDADGRTFQVATDFATLETVGGPNRVDGQRIRLEVATMGEDETVPHLRAVAINLIPGIEVVRKSITGASRWVSLLCKFADVSAEPENLSYFMDMYQDVPGRLDHYWKAVSYGAVTVAGSSASGWHDLPLNQTDYVPTPGSNTNANLSAIFDDCVTAADPFVDFSQFDGINLMINDVLDCCAWGGGRFTTLDGVTKSWRVSWNPPWGFGSISVVAHEMGHGFGLPHSNNSDGDSDPYDSPWDVMSSAGSYTVQDDTYGARGKHTIAHHKDRLGWILPAEKLSISSPGSYVATIDQLALSSTTNYRMAEVFIDSNRSYTVEVRQPFGDYDGALPGKAVLLNDVQLSGRSEAAWLLDLDDPPADFSDNEGVMWRPGEVFCSPDDLLQIEVLSETTDGYQVQIDSGLTSNCAPISMGDAYATLAGETLVIPAPGVLANDRDKNSADVLSALEISGSANGMVTLNNDGSFIYDPGPGFEGDDQFVYQAFDGSVPSNDATVTIKVLPPEYDFETASGNILYYYGISNTSAIGVKFDLFMTAHVTAVGASLYGITGTVFMAIVELDPTTGLPLDPTLTDVLAVRVVAPTIGVAQDIEVPVSVVLAAGRYGLVVGSGLHGASGEALLGVHDSGSMADFMFGDPTRPFMVNWNTEDGLRFFVRGIYQGQGYIFTDGFESGNTSAWNAAVP